MEPDDDSLSLYDSIAEQYASEFCCEKVLRAESNFVEELYHINPVRNGVLLDVGCGPGVYVPLAQMLSLTYIGIDQSTEMLKVARRLFTDVTLLQADARHLPLEAQQADFAVAMGSLSHMPNADFSLALSEIRRVLKVGGAFLLGDQIGSEPGRMPYPLSPGRTVAVYPRSEEWYLKELKMQGFEVMRREIRHPESGEIAFPKVLLWSQRSPF